MTVSLSSILIKAGNVDKATKVITDALITKVADILQIPISEIDASRPKYC